MKPAAADFIIASPDTLLRARLADPPLWKEVDEGWVGYAELAGHTFLLDPFSRFVLDAILSRENGIRRSELPDWLRELAPDLQPGDMADTLDAALEILHSAQLIESFPLSLEAR